MIEDSQEHYFMYTIDERSDAFLELHKQITTVINNIILSTEPDLKLQEIIDKFEVINSGTIQKDNLKKKDDKKKDRKKKGDKKNDDKKRDDKKKIDKLLANQYLDICSKLVNYSGKSKCINARIASFEQFLKKSKHLKWFASIERGYEYEEAREAACVVANDYFLDYNYKRRKKGKYIKATKQKIEFLKGEIENTKFCLESVNELSQSMEMSSLSEDNGIVTKDDLDNANALLEELLKKGKEAERKLEDYCKKENIKMSDVDKIISQSNNPVQKNKTVDNEIKKLESELTQMLSEKIREKKKELQDKQKLLIEKEVRQSALKGKHKDILNEKELIDSKEDSH